jgi:hypothetical protein
LEEALLDGLLAVEVVLNTVAERKGLEGLAEEGVLERVMVQLIQVEVVVDKVAISPQ